MFILAGIYFLVRGRYWAVLPALMAGVLIKFVPLLLFRLTGSPEAAGAYGGVSLAFASACQILTGRACDRNGLRLPLIVTPIGIIISVVGLSELVFTSKTAASSTKHYFFFYMVAGIVFMMLTTMSNFGVSYLERRVNRGVRRA